MSDKLSKSGSQLPSSSKTPRPKNVCYTKDPQTHPQFRLPAERNCQPRVLASDARILLARTVEVIPLSVQLWSALAPLESMNISTAISKFPNLYMVQGQIHQQQSNNTAARASFAAGIKSCPKEPTLWILASRLEEADGKSIKARQANPGNDLLWAKAARVCTGARVLWTHRVTERARD